MSNLSKEALLAKLARAMTSLSCNFSEMESIARALEFAAEERERALA